MTVAAPERIETERAQVPDQGPDTAPAAKDAGWMSVLAAFLATAAAAWMAGGIFRGGTARWFAIGGAVLGAGLIAGSRFTRRPASIQYAVLPLSVLVGAVAVLGDLSGGTANLVGLVGEAITSGGLKQPPVPFDPGWKFLLIVIFALLGAAAGSVSASTARPKLGAFLPVPVVLAASLVQPEGMEVLSSTVSIGLLVAAQAAAFGGELAGSGAVTGAFEARRLVRGALAIGLLMAVLIGIDRAEFLFPATERSQVIPPQRPKSQPLAGDRVIFTVVSSRPGPWRLGVLDVYDGRGWLLPPFDTSRLKELPTGRASTLMPRGADEGTQKTTFIISDIQGHAVPGVASPLMVRSPSAALAFDPRTQGFRTANERAPKGLTYTIESPVPPGGDALSEASPPGEALQEFLEAPPPPNEVIVLLRDAPQNLWDRLQYVRAKFYEKVVAAGAGAPADVPPARVVEMLSGVEGTPFEISAAEALLARWAGVPSRVGYGYYSGDRKQETFEVHPRHGSTWLEVYFEGHGWVPVVGVPPRARASLSEQRQRVDPNVQPTDELALVVYVPVQRTSVRLLYVYVRYWLLIAVPVLAGFAAILWGIPGLVKLVRSRRRRRWAGSDPRRRILVAYAEFRDAAADLTLRSVESPLGFLNRVTPDDEHEEFAWLVTRGLWGDLTRDLRVEDADAAEAMAASVSGRLRKAQPPLSRLLAFGSRASLRSPYSEEVPNLWPAWLRVDMRGGTSKAWSRMVRLLRRATASMLMALLAGCSTVPEHRPSGKLPEELMPATVQGLQVAREREAEAAFARAGTASLVAQGRVFTLRDADTVEASVQFGAFKPEIVQGRQRELRQGLLKAIGTGKFEATRLGEERVFMLRNVDQRMLLWLSPDGSHYQLMVATSAFAKADDAFLEILRFRRGSDEEVPATRWDPRRGGEL